MASTNPNQKASKAFPKVPIVVKELLSGGFAGSIGVFIGLPFDIVKVRMQVMTHKYRSGMDCFMRSVKEDGFRSLYRGGTSPVVANILINAVLFATDGVVMRILEPGNNAHADQNPRNHVIAGTIGGFVQCGVLVPFETVKCVMQVDGVMTETEFESKGKNGGNGGSGKVAQRKYSGTVDCARKIFNKEGVRGLYKGFNATAIREVPSFGIYMTSYKWCSSNLEEYVGQFSATAIGGAFAGICSWLVVYPADVVKTYVQTSTSFDASSSTIKVAQDLYAKGGWKVFFRGLGPTLARAVPVNAVTFVCYERFKLLSGL